MLKLNVSSIQPILISRFLINLRRSAGTYDHATGSDFSAPRFRTSVVATVVGDMGEPLQHGMLSEANDEDAGVRIRADGSAVHISDNEQPDSLRVEPPTIEEGRFLLPREVCGGVLHSEGVGV